MIPILKGIYTGPDAGFDISYPINREPVILETNSGISKGFLRAITGVTGIANGPGIDRGGINWNGVCYRVMGSKLVRVLVNDVVQILGDVGDDGEPVSMDYSFDKLAIGSAGHLYYWDGSTLFKVTDIDLGTVVDMMWIDSYFMTTDGVDLVVTELNDPTSVNPLKYGSSEVDPDGVVGLLKIRDEAYAINRNTIEVFGNAGGSGFPFARIPGAMIPKGCVSRKAKVLFADTFAFVGSGRNEPLAVYQAGSGQAVKISTRWVDDQLAAVDESDILLEARNGRDEARLYVRLPDKTLVFLATASLKASEPIWHVLTSGPGMEADYRPTFFTECYGKTICGDNQSSAIGVLDDTLCSQFGEVAGWQFDTPLIYNKANGGIVHSLELIGTPGSAPFGEDPRIFFSSTQDGRTWSQERAVSAGGFGDRRKRVQWRPHRKFSNWMGMRFRGADTAMAAWSGVEPVIEPLSN